MIFMLRLLLWITLVTALGGTAVPAPAETAYEVLVGDASVPAERAAGGGFSALVQDRLAALYQERVSAHDGARCLFQPTCSAFFREAVRTRRPLWAALMLIDRMMYRENRASLHRYPASGSGERREDPVYRNYIFAPPDYLR